MIKSFTNFVAWTSIMEKRVEDDNCVHGYHMASKMVDV